MSTYRPLRIKVSQSGIYTFNVQSNILKKHIKCVCCYPRVRLSKAKIHKDREWREREKTPEYDDMDKQACRAQQTEQTNGRLTDSGHRDRELKHAGA